MQLGFYFDQTRCIACCTCAVACKDLHDVPAGPSSWRRVTTWEKGRFPDLFVASLSHACYHCGNPSCIPACPADAITKRESDGVVVVDREECLGRDKCGGTCSLVCRYDAPQFGAERDAKMQKCDLCVDRLTEGNSPVCVASCPLRALDWGSMETLEAKYGKIHEADGFARDDNLEPSIVFKPKVDNRDRSVHRVDTAPFKNGVTGK